VGNSAVRSRSDPRISRRRKTVVRAGRRKLVVRFLLLVAMGALVYALFFSPWLQVRGVTVGGVQKTSPEQVIAAGGIGTADNLLLVSPNDVAERVERLPWVLRASVDRKLPGTVVVRVVERSPSVVLALGNRRWTIDAEGRVLTEGEAGDDLPVVAGVAVDHVTPGANLRNEALLSALKAFESLPSALRSEVAAVFAPTVERITFSLKDGIQVRYGAAEELGSKNEVLAILLKRLRHEGRTSVYLDVRVPSNPAVGPASASVPTEVP
jgi:cell division protein FtsQ